jgi:hypothetical protein
VRGVDEAIKVGIGDGRIDDHLVPVIDGELTGHNRGAAAVARGCSSGKAQRITFAERG